MKPTIKAYNSAEQEQVAHIEVSSMDREQLFRLKGWLEGVSAPKEMQSSFNDLLDLVTGIGIVLGPAVFKK